jgi:Flp pilus assembly protein TadG
MIEFALILPLLMALLLGTVTAGIAYNRDISLNNGARESARYGATLPVEGDIAAWLFSVVTVARESATGELDPSAPGQHICVAYVHPDGTTSDDRTVSVTETSGVRTVTIGTPCFSDGRPGDERRVQVQLRRESDIETILFTSTVTLEAESVTRFERASIS